MHFEVLLESGARIEDKDPYGRTVARCSVAGADLGAAMVSLGWAVDFRRYSEGAYAGEEAQARAAKYMRLEAEVELLRAKKANP